MNRRVGLIHQTPVIVEKATRDGIVLQAKIEFIHRHQDEFLRLYFCKSAKDKSSEMIKRIRQEFGYSDKTFWWDILQSFRNVFRKHVLTPKNRK